MEKQVASLAELKATFPSSTAEWRETQLEAGASLSEAAIGYAKHVETKAAKEREEHKKELEAAAAKAKASSGSLGHQPITAGRAAGQLESIEGGDPVEDFNAAVAKIAGARPTLQARQAAVRAVASRRPELYQAYLLATNPGKRQSRLISEKLEASSK